MWENGGRLKKAQTNIFCTRMANHHRSNLEGSVDVNSFGMGQAEKGSKYSGMLLLEGLFMDSLHMYTACCFVCCMVSDTDLSVNMIVGCCSVV